MAEAWTSAWRHVSGVALSIQLEVLCISITAAGVALRVLILTKVRDLTEWEEKKRSRGQFATPF